MSDSMILEKEIVLKASPAQVWDLLVNPEKTKQYMFGCEVVSDWKIGSPVLWNGTTENGEVVMYVKGEVLEFEPEKKLTFSTLDPNTGIEDIPENYVDLKYEICKVERGTLLKVHQGDFATVAEGEKRYLESQQGWDDLVFPAMEKVLAAE